MSSVFDTYQCLPGGKFFGLPKASRRYGSIGLAESTYGKDEYVRPHAHTLHHFVFILAGCYEEEFEGGTFVRRPMQLLFLPATVWHAEQWRPGRHFMIELYDEWQDQVEVCVTLSRPTLITHPEAVKLAMHLYREFSDPDPFREWVQLIEGLVAELLVILGRQRQQRPPAFVRDAWEFLCQHFAEPLTLKRLAEKVGVHPVHLARSCQRWYKRSVREFLLERRILLACEQLIETDATLTNIAGQAGFSDRSYFGNVFRKITGVTPREYRRRHKSAGRQYGPRGLTLPRHTCPS